MLHNPDEERLFPALPPDMLAQFREHGEELTFEDGEALFTEGQSAYDLFVVLEGEVRVTKSVGGETTLLTIHRPGQFTGEISLLTGNKALASGHALGRTRAIRVKADTLRQLVAKCSPLARQVLGAMAGRSQEVESQLRQQEKLAALGKLSAGLAHELNNPAAAAQRASAQLRAAIQESQECALDHDCRFGDKERNTIRELWAVLRERPQQTDSLAQSDAEEALGSWLDTHDVADAWCMASTLAGAGLSEEDLGRLHDFSSEALAGALGWLQTALNTHELTRTVEQSSGRIAELVKAMKQYSYMDQAKFQEIDVRDGLESTLKVFAHRLKKAVTVQRNYAQDLPKLCAYAGELNQVWTNLIDNALDAMHDKGELRIRTARVDHCVMVEIGDNGPGIPPEIQRRIFEPFFTTKGVGEGTGLGLDISYRIITRRHRGEIKVISQPGDTRFQVFLPIRQPGGNNGQAMQAPGPDSPGAPAHEGM